MDFAIFSGNFSESWISVQKQDARSILLKQRYSVLVAFETHKLEGKQQQKCSRK
jgi:hypothetical protein